MQEPHCCFSNTHTHTRARARTHTVNSWDNLRGKKKHFGAPESTKKPSQRCLLDIKGAQTCEFGLHKKDSVTNVRDKQAPRQGNYRLASNPASTSGERNDQRNHFGTCRSSSGLTVMVVDLGPKFGYKADKSGPPALRPELRGGANAGR